MLRPGHFLAALLLIPAAAPLAAQQLTQIEVAELKAEVQATGGRVIISVKPSVGPRLQSNGLSAMSDQAVATVQARLQQRGLQNARRVNLVPLVFGEVTGAELEALLADPNVLSVEPDVEMPLAEWRPSSFSELALASASQSLPWGIDRVTAPAAWALRSPALDGKGIKVAFMDSGGDINHPDLKFAGGYDATSNSTSPSAWNDDVLVCNGHGTHVAGTIGALNDAAGVVGVAPGASLYPIKVFRNSNGSCLASVSHQISGLNWAVSQGIRVVSISIGGTTYVSSYEQAINAAASAGTFVVAAAGNNGSSTLTYPGRYANALAIGGTTSSDALASWSNYGSDLYAVAPGASIYSTMPGGAYGTKSGTSMATPHAAGVVALVLAANPGASRSQVLSRLQSGALDLGAPGRDNEFGYGLTRAYQSISGSSIAPPPPSAPLALAVSPNSRRASAVAGSSTAIKDSASVSLSGDGSGTTGWTASKRKAWTTLTTASGTGSGKVRWSRNPTGLSAGTYIDTITVATSGLSARIIDTLIITAAPVATPLALAVSPSSRRVDTEVDKTTSFSTSATVTLSGEGNATAAWTASKRKAWTTLTTAGGTGSGTVAWKRSGAGLAVGIYVDTITVAVNGLSARIIDTLVVNSTALKLTVTPKGSKAQGKAGTAEILADSGDVILTGTGSSTATWTASRRSAWLNLLTVSGVGSGKIRWTRNTSGLVAGTYVDTITVVTSGAAESPNTIIDTLVITNGPGGGNGNGGGNAKTNPGGGKKTSVSSSTAQAVEIVYDSIEVYLDQANAPAFTWTATSDVPWLHLLRTSGTGDQHVTWSRDAETLPEGLHIAQVTLRLLVEGAEYTVAFADTVIAGVEDPGVTRAAEELFDPTNLTVHQRRLLDQLGNRNGLYDLGDFLAWVEYTGTSPHASVMTRVMALPPTSTTAGARQPESRK